MSVVLIVISSQTTLFSPVRQWLAGVSYPFYWLTAIPARLSEWSDETLASRSELEAENRRLRSELLVSQGRSQRMAELAAENVRLRALLNATELLRDRVMLTELVGVSPDPLSHILLVNRGANDDVYVGQPLVDSDGLMGQVVEVFENHSRVLLVSDPSHALPVQVVRNGVRAIAEGTGDKHRLRLRFVAPTTDIVEGDLLVSSGLGGRYPVGFPVGQVVAVDDKTSEAFLEVEVQPSARIDRSRHLLLVFTQSSQAGR